jgi:ribosomal protein L7/L12
MRYTLNMPKSACSVLALSAVLCTAIIAGCDSSGDPNSPEARAQVEARQKQVREEEDKANELLRKRQGKQAEVIKSFKGGAGAALPQPK